MAKNRVLNKIGQIAHQGDVFIRKVADHILPHTGKLEKVDGIHGLIVQHGEAMGHYHTVDAEEGVQLSISSFEAAVKKMLLTTTKTVSLKHPEHGDMIFTPGSYEIHTQREAQPNGFLKPVID